MHNHTVIKMISKQENMKHEQQWLGSSSVKGHYSIHRLFHITISSTTQYSNIYLDLPCLDLCAHTHTHWHILLYWQCVHTCLPTITADRSSQSFHSFVTLMLCHLKIVSHSCLSFLFSFLQYSSMARHFFPYDPLSASYRLFHHLSILIVCVFVF